MEMISELDICGEFFFSDWLRNRNTTGFPGVWEQINNPDSNCGEFAIIKSQDGLNGYRLSAKERMEKKHIGGIISVGVALGVVAAACAVEKLSLPFQTVSFASESYLPFFLLFLPIFH